MEIAKNIHLVPGVIANCYVIVDPGGLTLIDAGLPNRAKNILGYLHSIGYQAADLRRIIITHADVDHVGSLEPLRAVTHARVAASQIEADAIRSGKSSRELKGGGLFKFLMSIASSVMKPTPSQVDDLASDGDSYPPLGGLQVMDTPGHTPGHISLWSPSTRLLFSGDSILVKPGGFLPSTGRNNWDQPKSDDSFQIQADLHPLAVFGGHGWTDQEVEQKFSRYFESRREYPV